MTPLVIDLIAKVKAGDVNGVRDLLHAAPELVQERTPEGVSLISLACYMGRPDIAALFAECDVILDIFDACAVGNEGRVRSLVGHFPDSVNAYSPDGFYPLGLAAFFGHRAIVAYLLENDADVHQVARNALKVAPIHAAVSRGDIEIVRLLIEKGADVNARQQGGFTPLHGAAGNGNTDLVDLLLQHGADPAAKTDDGKTATDIAGERGHQELADRLSQSSFGAAS